MAIRILTLRCAVVWLLASGNLTAQVPATRMVAAINDSGARFEIPREFLGVIRDSALCTVSWDRSFKAWRIGERGIVITVFADSATAAGYQVQSVGSINVMAPRPEAGIHGHVEGQRLIVELGPSSGLNSLLHLRPDSIRVDAPLWGPGSQARYVYPTYGP